LEDAGRNPSHDERHATDPEAAVHTGLILAEFFGPVRGGQWQHFGFNQDGFRRVHASPLFEMKSPSAFDSDHPIALPADGD
jgi:hypothetical protein